MSTQTMAEQGTEGVKPSLSDEELAALSVKKGKALLSDLSDEDLTRLIAVNERETLTKAAAAELARRATGEEPEGDEGETEQPESDDDTPEGPEGVTEEPESGASAPEGPEGNTDHPDPAVVATEGAGDGLVIGAKLFNTGGRPHRVGAEVLPNGGYIELTEKHLRDEKLMRRVRLAVKNRVLTHGPD